MSDRTTHKQVSIAWGEMSAEVDEELAPLILALWKAGICTCNSCQENRPGIAWIQFLTMINAKEFLDLIAVYPDKSDIPFWETLYDRIVGDGSDEDWQYDVHPTNWSVEEEEVEGGIVENCTGPADFDFFVSIRFPKTDIPLILERLKEESAEAGM